MSHKLQNIFSWNGLLEWYNDFVVQFHFAPVFVVDGNCSSSTRSTKHNGLRIKYQKCNSWMGVCILSSLCKHLCVRVYANKMHTYIATAIIVLKLNSKWIKSHENYKFLNSQNPNKEFYEYTYLNILVLNSVSRYSLEIIMA